MQARSTEALWLVAHPPIALSDLADLSGLSQAELLMLTEYGVFSPADPAAANPSYPADCLVTARVAFRLRKDLELNLEGLALVLNLMQQMQALKTELVTLRAMHPARIEPG